MVQWQEGTQMDTKNTFYVWNASLMFMQTLVTLSPSSCELRVVPGTDVHFSGLVASKDSSCQRQCYVVGLVNNEENVIMLFSGSVIKKKEKKQEKNNVSVRAERCRLFDSSYTLGITVTCFEHLIFSFLEQSITPRRVLKGCRMSWNLDALTVLETKIMESQLKWKNEKEIPW